MSFFGRGTNKTKKGNWSRGNKWLRFHACPPCVHPTEPPQTKVPQFLLAKPSRSRPSPRKETSEVKARRFLRYPWSPDSCQCGNSCSSPLAQPRSSGGGPQCLMRRTVNGDSTPADFGKISGSKSWDSLVSHSQNSVIKAVHPKTCKARSKLLTYGRFAT